MDINLTGYLLFIGCGVLLCILWFAFALRGKAGNARAAVVSLLTLALGVLLGLALARLVWVLCMISYHPSWTAVRYDELSYYGGMAGVILAVSLAAKCGGLRVREVLNTFAPMGALLAAVFRFGEFFLGDFGVGAWMEEGLFFPLTLEITDGYYSDYYQAVFMLEGFFSLVAMALCLVHTADRYRWVRTVFYLCLPQILCESLRLNAISWRFVRSEQLFCFLICEGVLVGYALAGDWRKRSSWTPALMGLLVCALVIVAEFAKDGKITFGGQMISQWIIYGTVAAGLALLAVMEHLGYRRLPG